MNDSWISAFRKASQYKQSGTDIPTFSEGSGGAGVAGSDIQPQGFGYSYQSPEYLAGLSFDINKSAGPLGKRSGEQLQRLQQGSGEMQNEQPQKELMQRGLFPTGVQLPPV